MLQQKYAILTEAESAAFSFIDEYNASLSRETMPAVATGAGRVTGESHDPTRLTHELARSWSLQSGDAERKSAAYLQYGLPSDPDRLKEVSKFFAEHAGGEVTELASYVRRLNRQLRQLDSEMKVEFRSLDANYLLLEFSLSGPNEILTITTLDRKPLLEKRRAEDIADILSQAPLNDMEQALLESKVKEAYLEGAAPGVMSLVNATNVRLAKDCVEYSLASVKFNSNGMMFAVKLTLDWGDVQTPEQSFIWVWRI